MINEVVGNYLFCKMLVVNRKDSDLSEELVNLMDQDEGEKIVEGCICLEGIREFFEGETPDMTAVFRMDGVYYDIEIPFKEFSKHFKKFLNSKNFFKSNN